MHAIPLSDLCLTYKEKLAMAPDFQVLRYFAKHVKWHLQVFNVYFNEHYIIICMANCVPFCFLFKYLSSNLKKKKKKKLEEIK